MEPKPFQTTAKGESSQRHFPLWAGVLCYVVRLFLSDNGPPVNNDDTHLLLPKVKHTRAQLRATANMVGIVVSESGHAFRQLFVTILTCADVLDPAALWSRFANEICNDLPW